LKKVSEASYLPVGTKWERVEKLQWIVNLSPISASFAFLRLEPPALIDRLFYFSLFLLPNTFFLPDCLASKASRCSHTNIVSYSAASGNGWGLVKLEPASTSPWQAAGRHHYVCYASRGDLIVVFGERYTVDPEM
jgi:hypothetical protein